MSEQVTREEAEALTRKLFQQIDSIPVGELEQTIDFLYKRLEAEGIPKENAEFVMRHYRDRLYNELGVVYGSPRLDTRRSFKSRKERRPSR